MGKKALQLTLRELQTMMTSPVTLTILGVIGVVLAISGPFGTLDGLPAGGRFAFWMVTVYATFTAGQFGGALMNRLLSQRPPQWVRVPLVGIAAGVPVWIVVMVINLVSFGPGTDSGPGALSLLFYCVVIATGVVVGFSVFEAQQATAEPQEATEPAPPPARILARLDATKRGELVSLSVQDHYVEVVTTAGRTLILMRLGDAIAEAEGVPGVQVHRSHWVALAGAARVVRRNGRIFIETRAGDTLPVSRTQQAAAREAGLIA